jgi:hypothetical protein
MKGFIKTVLAAVLLGMVTSLSAQWQPDFRITNNDSSSRTGWNNSWAVAANGNMVHLVWWDTRNLNQEIYYNSSADTGLTWGADRRLTNNANSSQDPGVAVSGDTVHVVWQDNRDGNYEIYYKRSTDAGATWGSDSRLSNNSSWSGLPSLASSGPYIFVVWCDDRDGNREIYGRRSIDGGGSWGGETRLTTTSDWGWTPSVALLRDTVQVVWYESDPGGNLGKDIFHIRSTDAGTTWSIPDTLTHDPANSWRPSIGVSGLSVHVVWQDNRDGNYEIYYKRSTDAGATWGSDSRLTTDSYNSVEPSLAVSGANLHLAWTDDRDQNSEIYYKFSANMGQSWGPDERLTNEPATSWYGSIAASGRTVHIAWYDQRDGNWEVYYKRNPTGNMKISETQPLENQPPARPEFFTVPSLFRDKITIRFRMPLNPPLRIALYDAGGRAVFVKEFPKVFSPTILNNRSIADLGQGVYFLSISAGKSKSAPVKLIKF